MRQRDALWWQADPLRRIRLHDAQFPAVIPDDGTGRIETQGDHVIVAIVAAREATFVTPPLRYEFFSSTITGAADFEEPVEPIYEEAVGYLGEFPTDSGLEPTYAYLYVLPLSAVTIDGHLTGAINYRAGPEPMGTTYTFVAALGISNLAELGPIQGITFDTATPAHTIPAAAGGEVDINGVWLMAAMPAGHRESGDVALVDWPEQQQGTDGAAGADGEVGVPGFIIGHTGATSGDDLEFAFSEDGTIRGVWLQLLPVPVPATVAAPATVVTTNTFVATTRRPVGAVLEAPPAAIVNEFASSATMPSTGSAWRAVLVDAAGTTLARMPRAIIGEIVQTLNDLDTAQVTIAMSSRAGQLVDEADVLPELEVQIWRGDVLWVWGPVVDADPQDDHWSLAVQDCRWHFTRRHVGELGGSFGGKPPYFHDEIVNERFTDGGLSGWSIFRTITTNGVVGFDTPEIGAITLAPETHLPSGEPMARCVSPLDPLDNYQLFQDIVIKGPQNRRELTATLSGWWFIPSVGNFAPNNLGMGLLLAVLDDELPLPAGYYRPTAWEFDPLDDTAPRDELFYREVSITLPPGIDSTVHVAVCFPQGISFVGGLELQVDDGLLYNESPTTIGPGLVMHAQDAAFAKSDVNVGWSANTVGDQVIREYLFRDHTNIGQAIQDLADDGYFDWSIAYSTSTRIATFTAPRRGSHRPRSRCRLDATGRGNVARIRRRRMWQSASTVVAAQTRTNGNHERAARSDHDLTLEEVFVAPREPRDYDLTGLARRRIDSSADAEVVEIESHAGDERLLLDLEPGDTTDVLCDVPGHLVAGPHRLVQRTIDPTHDRAKLSLNPT